MCIDGVIQEKIACSALPSLTQWTTSAVTSILLLFSSHLISILKFLMGILIWKP